MFCEQCGHQNLPNRKFCSSCGLTFRAAPPPQAMQAFPSDAFLCLSCGQVGYPQKIWQGTALTEIGLLVISILLLIVSVPLAVVSFFVFLIYGIWRIFSRKQGCKICKNINLIPVTSPVAAKFLNQ